MKRLFGRLFITAGGVLSWVERLLSNPKRSRRARKLEFIKAYLEAKPSAPAEAPTEPPTAAKTPERNFSIKRTKSEVGYVYWILEGHGRYKCYVLCDTWDEAMAQAKAKLAEVDGEEVRAAAASSVG